jgi:hypothetical protein
LGSRRFFTKIMGSSLMSLRRFAIERIVRSRAIRRGPIG